MDTEKLVLSVMELLSFLPFMLPMCNMDMGHIHLLWAVTFFKTWLKISKLQLIVFLKCFLVLCMYLGHSCYPLEKFRIIWYYFLKNFGFSIESFLWFYFTPVFEASPEFEELFLAEMVHKVSQGTGEVSFLGCIFSLILNKLLYSNLRDCELYIVQDILFCSGFQDSSGKSGNSFVHCSSALSGEISYVSMINILLCYIGLDQVLDVDVCLSFISV